MRFLPLITVLALTACKREDGFITYDNPPTATIVSPDNDEVFDEGDLVQFAARVNDDGDSLSIQWSSDIDGMIHEEEVGDIGEISFSTNSLSPGTHAVTLTVIDAAAQSGEAVVALEVLEVLEEPVIAVVHPFSGETGVEGIPFTAQAQVEDTQDDPQALRVNIDSDIDGSLCVDVVPDLAGIASCNITPTPGVHTLTFTVRDSDGFDASATALFSVSSGDDIDNDADGFTENQGDCNDADPTISPAAVEFLNGRDDDCDGIVDNGTNAYDDDGDGFSENDGDCDDADPLIHPDAIEFSDGIDNDCDGLIDNGTDDFDDDGDGFSEATGDCNDNNININPNAADVAYNGVDEDCDGTDLVDVDGDGHDADIAGGDDCDDTDSAINPGATDNPYNGIDEDCQDGDLVDVDGDGFAYDGIIGGTDCDDTDADINPDGLEIAYDGIDQDCNGVDLTDADGDGQDSAAAGGQDCNDDDPTIFAGATEVPYDAIDQDCDGLDLTDVDGDGVEGGTGPDCDDQDPQVFPGATEVPYNGTDDDCLNGDLVDVDGDGYTGGLAGGDDCDDDDAGINPGATEVPYNGTDEDCQGGDLRDVDGDGFEASAVGGSDCDDSTASISPSAPESCDGIDNNCADGIDEIGALGCTTHYIDGDGDGYGSNVGECTCGVDFPYEVTNSNDCYDNNGNARPGQTAYFASHRGDGSYDFNCDGAGSRRWTATGGDCGFNFPYCNLTVGWTQSTPPSCGQTRGWIDSCPFGCGDEPDARTQECR